MYWILAYYFVQESEPAWNKIRVWEREFRVTPDHDLYDTQDPILYPDPPGDPGSRDSGSLSFETERKNRETLTPSVMEMLRSKCPNLKELHLLCLNVNANTFQNEFDANHVKFIRWPVF